MQFWIFGEDTVLSSVINFRIISFTSQTLHIGHTGAVLSTTSEGLSDSISYLPYSPFSNAIYMGVSQIQLSEY